MNGLQGSRLAAKQGACMKKVCIVGAGAIGGLIGTRLAAAGTAQVSALARGATLEALCSQGWRMQSTDGLLQATAVASSDPRKLGVQDLVVIAVKCTALTQVAQMLAPLIGPETLVMPAMNGVPWWFCHGIEGLPQGILKNVDPDGAVAAAIPFAQVLGCVVHASAHSRRYRPKLMARLNFDLSSEKQHAFLSLSPLTKGNQAGASRGLERRSLAPKRH